MKQFLVLLLILCVTLGVGQTKVTTNRLTLQGFDFTPAQVAALPIGSSWYNSTGDTLHMKTPGGVFLWDMTRTPAVGESWQWDGTAFTLTTITGGVGGVIGDSVLVFKYSNGTGAKTNVDTVKVDITQLLMTASAGNAITLSTIQAIDTAASPTFRRNTYSYLAPYSMVGLSATRQTTGIAPGTSGYPLLSTGASSSPAFGQLPLSTGVTGVLGYLNGGTGSILTPTLGSVLYGDGTAWRTGTGTTGQFMRWSHLGKPTSYDIFGTESWWAVSQNFETETPNEIGWWFTRTAGALNSASLMLDSSVSAVKVNPAMKLAENATGDEYYTMSRSGNEWFVRRSDQSVRTKLIDEGDGATVLMVADTARVTRDDIVSTDRFIAWYVGNTASHGTIQVRVHNGYVRFLADELGQPANTYVAYMRLSHSR
jgi:hypothetical protein